MEKINYLLGGKYLQIFLLYIVFICYIGTHKLHTHFAPNYITVAAAAVHNNDTTFGVLALKFLCKLIKALLITVIPVMNEDDD